MKKQNLLLVLLFAATQLFAQVPNYVPTNGLVGWYPFNGNANDESGNNNNGTVNGATLTTDRNGNTNKAYDFNGNSSYISTNNSPLINPPFTITAWVLLDSISLPTINPIISLGQSGSNFLKKMYLSPDLGSNGTPSIGTVGANDITSTNSLFTNGLWKQIAVTVSNYSTNGVTFYVDGVAYNQNTTQGTNVPFPLNNSGFTIGYQSVNGNIAYFNGKIDDIGIWNRALTQQEITALYNSCSTPPSATITPNGNTTFCQGGSVVLQASGGNSYSWSNGATTQSITVTQGNTYSVTVTDGNSCTASASQVVTVNPIPSVNFSLPAFISNTVNNFSLNATPSGGTFSGTGVNGTVFDASQAGLGNKTISYSVSVNNCSNTATANTIVYDTTGAVCTITTFDTVTTTVFDTITTTINDTVTTSVSVTDTLLIDVTITSLTPPNNTNTVKVYPNPANNALFINNGNLASMAGYSIKITNSLGQIFFDEPVNQQQFFIDISTWATGTYLLYVINPQQAVVETKQVVLQ